MGDFDSDITGIIELQPSKSLLVMPQNYISIEESILGASSDKSQQLLHRVQFSYCRTMGKKGKYL